MTVLGVLRLAIRIGLSWLLAFPFGMQSDGIWIGMSLSNVIIGSVSIPFLLSKRWQRPRIETTSAEEPVPETSS